MVYGTSDKLWLDYHISVREFLPNIIVMDLWGTTLTNSALLFHPDNIAVVHIINSNTSKDANLMKLIRRLMVSSLTHNVQFSSEHIPGLDNTATDLLSRLQFSRFRTLYPLMATRALRSLQLYYGSKKDFRLLKDVRSCVFSHIFRQIFYFQKSASYFISSGKFRFYNAI